MHNGRVWYLYHSGFAVETARHFLVFDYYLDRPKEGKLEDGVISPEEIGAFGKKVVVFVSHAHADHFNRVIFSWQEQIPSIRYVVSQEVPAVPQAIKLEAQEKMDLRDLSVQTLRSTDLGVAFLVRVDDACIYHAGDLNWWHWEGETPAYNRQMAADYQQQIDFLAGEKVDLAFVPVDPRLEGSYSKGIDYFMEKVGAEKVFPMHFGEEYAVINRLKHSPKSAGYREHLVSISHRGEEFEW